jgi:hypothetical protein
VYSSQDFAISGGSGSISGEVLLDKIFNIKDVDSWGMFGTLLAWIALIRIAHYALFTYDVWPYLNK